MSQHEMRIFFILYPFLKNSLPEKANVAYLRESDPVSNVNYYFPPPTAAPDTLSLLCINDINMWIPRRLYRAISSNPEGTAALNQFKTEKELNSFMKEMGDFFRQWNNWALPFPEVVKAFESYRSPAPVTSVLKREGIFASDLKSEPQAIMDPQPQSQP